jgi:hypothetical protein
MNMTKRILFCVALAAIAGCRYAPDGNGKSAALFFGDRVALLGAPYRAEPRETELLCKSGEFSLVAGETAADTAANKSDEEHDYRNSLFLKRCRRDGTIEWRLLLTTGSDWSEADGMSEWESDRAKDVKGCFEICKASFSSDGRHLWLVCSPHTYTYSVVCSYDVFDQKFRVLIDGDTADEQPDGTILAKNKKTYLFDDNGEPLGARFYDAWITPDGKVVRKGKLKTADEVD